MLGLYPDGVPFSPGYWFDVPYDIDKTVLTEDIIRELILISDDPAFLDALLKVWAEVELKHIWFIEKV